MVNILFVAWEFPPLTAGGVQRPLYFVKYLQQFGINPIVITVEDYKSFGKRDETLLKEIPASVTLERITCDIKQPANKIAEWINVYWNLVDQHSLWWDLYLAVELPRIVEKYQPKALYVTIPPFSMAPLWTGIARKYSIPLVLDFRDAWSQWVMAPFGSWFHYKGILNLERKCIELASAIICTSEQTSGDLKRLHKGLSSEKVKVITNGFDGEMMQWRWQNESHVGTKFTIGYVGSFYYFPAARQSVFTPWWKKPPHRMIQYSPRKEDWLYRSPYFFFKAVAELLRKAPHYKDRIVIKFAGAKQDWIDDQLDEFGLGDICEFVGFLNHEKVIEFQRQCDALLLTSSKVINGRDYSIAGKTFEYFQMAKPIVAFVCEGAQKDILSPTGIAIICDPDNTNESAGQLRLLLDGKTRLNPNYSYLKSFERKKLAKDLADLLLAKALK